jgi:hypothetical protein
MRELSTTLLAAQKAYSKNPLYKVVLTKGAATYTYDVERILPSAHDEEPYSHRATIVLSNHDGDLDDIDLRGFKGVLSYGAISTAGEEYSATAPVWVIDQQFDSNPNKLTCTLELVGAFDLMADDEANDSYVPEGDDDTTVKEYVEAIVGATLTCFSHCKSFEVVWDAGYDALADTYKPKDGFRIYTSGKRLAALRRVLDYTANVARFREDGKVHILKPVTSGTTYDYEYSLERGAHVFFSKAYKNTLVRPNKVQVQSFEEDDPYYSGEAQIDGYNSLPAEVKNTKYIQAKLESDDQADDIAEALIAKAEMWSKRGGAEVPLNAGAEVFDYVKVTDSRQGDERTGNLGYVHRRFGGKDKWTMTFGFGNWLDQLKYNAILKDLETYTDIDNYFSRLRVGSLYAYLDDIKDGPDLYIRQRSLHLDATGVYVTDLTLYAIRLPGEAEHNLWKGDTALEDPETGDFWIDTNYEPNVVKIWDGDSWEEATTAQLEEFNRGTILRRLKQSALTANGLVVLDETQEGTYGLVLATSIEAGKILLSKTVKDGLWYEETGVVLDATYGIALYGGQGINAFRTFATKADYIAGTPVQVYIGTDGKLYAGAGGVSLDVTGLSTYGTAIHLYDESLVYSGCLGIQSGTPNQFWVIAFDGELCLSTENYDGTGGDIVLKPETNYVKPGTDNLVRLGSTAKQFYGGYFASRLKIPVGTDMYD